MPNEKANQNQESNLQFQAVTSEKQYASSLMKAQWKSKSKPRKQLNVSNTDLRKASSHRGIQWNPNEKANQNQESNLKFQTLISEKHQAFVEFNETPMKKQIKAKKATYSFKQWPQKSNMPPI